MKINASTISLTVEDVAASVSFLTGHFGFQKYAADEENNFASLGREDAGITVVFLRRGNEVLPESYRDTTAAGIIVAFTVDGDLEIEQKRLQDKGVEITLPLMEESWGERLFQVTDSNGIVYQLVEWANEKPY